MRQIFLSYRVKIRKEMGGLLCLYVMVLYKVPGAVLRGSDLVVFESAEKCG